MKIIMYKSTTDSTDDGLNVVWAKIANRNIISKRISIISLFLKFIHPLTAIIAIAIVSIPMGAFNIFFILQHPKLMLYKA